MTALTAFCDSVEEFFLLSGHLPGSLFCPFVFIAEKVENTVDHQEGDHLHLVQPELLHLTPGGLDRDHQIAQEMGMEAGEITFSHGKGEDIGRLVRAEVSSVQYPDLIVIDQ